MTLMELMFALAILSLSAGLAFANIGPWLTQSRTSAGEAGFWRSVSPAQLVIAELAAGAIDPSTRVLTTTDARFRAMAPRLSPTPIDARLTIVRAGDRSRLVFRASELNEHESVLLDATAPLRFQTESEGALVVEIERGGVWTPLASARFAADAPFVCAFDPIPRSCR